VARRLNQAGLSIVEIIVAMGMMSVLSLGVVSLVESSMKSSKSVEMSADANSLISEISFLLSDQARCNASLAPQNAVTTPAGTVNRMIFIDGGGTNIPRFPTVAQDANAVYGSSRTQIMSYQLSDADPEADVAQGTTDLIVTLDRAPFNTGFQKVRRIRLGVTVNASNNIVTCRSLSGGSGESLWRRTTSNPNDIFYQGTGGTRIGVNTDSPWGQTGEATIDIAGDGSQSQLFLRHNAPNSSPSGIHFVKGRGASNAAPSPALAGDALGAISAVTAFHTWPNNASSHISFMATENQTATAQGQMIVLGPVRPGTLQRQDTLIVHGSGRISVNNGPAEYTPQAGIDMLVTSNDNDDNDIQIRSYTPNDPNPATASLILSNHIGTPSAPQNWPNGYDTGSLIFSAQQNQAGYALPVASVSSRVNSGWNSLVTAGGSLTFSTQGPTVAEGIIERARIDEFGNLRLGHIWTNSWDTYGPVWPIDVRKQDADSIIQTVNTSSSAARFPGYNVSNYIGGLPVNDSGVSKFTTYTQRGSESSPSPVQQHDDIGILEFFGGVSSNNNDFVRMASIRADVDGVVATGPPVRGPGRLQFFTAGPQGDWQGTERMRIDSTGKVTIGRHSTNPDLSIAHQRNALSIMTTDVSTAVAGPNLPRISLFGYSNDFNHSSGGVTVFRGRGTHSAPQYVQNGDRMGYFSASNHMFPIGAYAGIDIYATENHTAARNGMNLVFSVVPNGQVGSEAAMRIDENTEVVIGGGVGKSGPGERDIPFSISRPGGAVAMHIGTAGTAPTDGVATLYVSEGGHNSTTSWGGSKGWEVGARGGNWSGGSYHANDFYFSYWNGATWSVENTFLIDSVTGNVQIGFPASPVSPTHKLDVNGRARAVAWDVVSDERLKRDIKPMEFDVERLLSLKAVNYTWRDKRRGEKTELGLIAQDVKEAYPELVSEDSEGYLSVNYSQLVAPLIEAVRSLFARILGLESRTAALEAELASSRQENAQLNQKLDALSQRLERLEQQSRAPSSP
jgi:Tfp pilus assembly protein PilV